MSDMNYEEISVPDVMVRVWNVSKVPLRPLCGAYIDWLSDDVLPKLEGAPQWMYGEEKEVTLHSVDTRRCWICTRTNWPLAKRLGVLIIKSGLKAKAESPSVPPAGSINFPHRTGGAGDFVKLPYCGPIMDRNVFRRMLMSRCGLHANDATKRVNDVEAIEKKEAESKP